MKNELEEAQTDIAKKDSVMNDIKNKLQEAESQIVSFLLLDAMQCYVGIIIVLRKLFKRHLSMNNTFNVPAKCTWGFRKAPKLGIKGKI